MYYFLTLLADYKNCRLIKRLKRTIRLLIGILLGLYISVILLLNLPYVQQQMSVFVSGQLSSVLGSELSIGRINLGFLNRIIIDDLKVKDLSDREMLKVTRLSAKFDLLPLLEGKISISNIQLFGFDIRLNKATPESDPNFQFIVDAFKPREQKSEKKDIDLRINSLLIRRGTLAYDILSEKNTPGKFNAAHIALDNIIANISLKALRNDSINASIKRLSITETHSGFDLNKLSMRAIGNDKGMRIENFEINLPHSVLRTDTIQLRYDSLDAFKDFVREVDFSFRMKPSRISPKDLSAFLPAFNAFQETLEMEIKASGSIDRLNCSRLSISSPQKHFYLRGNASFQDLAHPADAYIMASLSNLYADREGLAFLLRNFGAANVSTIQNLGTVSFQGQLSGYFTDLVTYGRIQTSLGNLNTDIKISKQEDRLAYSGKLETENFNLGSLTNNSKLGKITFNLDVNGNHRKQHYPQITMKGLIASIEYSQYAYQNITLDGEYKQGGFNGKLVLDDVNGSIALNGSFNTAGTTPTFDFLATLNHVRPHDLHLTPQYENAEFSARLKANFTGGAIDEMNGEINLDSLYFKQADK